MAHLSLEVYFKAIDETPLDIDIQEIEIIPDDSDGGFIYFGMGSTFIYKGVQYRILNIETRYFHPVSGRYEDTEPTEGDDATHLKVIYIVEHAGW